MKNWTPSTPGERWEKPQHTGDEPSGSDPKLLHPIAWLADWAVDVRSNFFMDKRVWRNHRWNGTELVDAEINPEVRHWRLFQVSELPHPSDKGERLGDALFHHWYQGSFFIFFKHLFKEQEGTVLEISGDWIEQPGPPPTDPAFYHVQFAKSPAQRKVMRALGCPGFPGKHGRTRPFTMEEVWRIGSTKVVRLGRDRSSHHRRQSKVVVLQLIMTLDPERYSAMEVFCWANQAEQIASKKLHSVGSQEHRDRAHLLFTETGRWGGSADRWLAWGTS